MGKVEALIGVDTDFHEQKRAYLVDNLKEEVKSHQEKQWELSFAELIDEYSNRYDSLNAVFRKNKETNTVLDAILELEKAESVSLDADRGFIIFSLNFQSIFVDSIDYMVLTYRYIDDYGNEYFAEESKLSHQAAGKFEGKLQSIMTDVLNGQNEIIYIKTELSAAEVLQKSYGVEDIKSGVEKEYLSEGLRVEVSAVKFADRGFIHRRNGDWKYYSN